MRRFILGGAVMAAFVGSTLAVGPREAEASKPWTPTTKLACVKCHTKGTKGDDKDLTACGKESLEVLKKGNYKRGANEAEQKEWGNKLLKGFKCP